MRRLALVGPNLLLVTLATLSACASASAETTLRIGGTGSAMESAAALAKAYASASHHALPRVTGNLGTGGALKALNAGALDIAFAAGGGSEWNGDAKLASLPLSRTALVFAVNPGVRARSITLEQAIELYGGEQSTWPDGKRVRPVLRPMSDSDTSTLRYISRAFDVAVLRAHAIQGLQTAITDEDSVADIAATPGAFGTTTLAMLATAGLPQVTVLALDGVAPTQKTLSDGSYKLTKTVYFVFRAPASPEVAQFRDFALSARGREILLQHGQIPVPASAPATSR